jgi:hypothetical protein
MKTRFYAGVLRRPMVLDPSMSADEIEAARRERMEALFAFYGIAEPFTDAGWKGLAEALAQAHVPAFSHTEPKKRQPAGNKWKLSNQDFVEAVYKVLHLRDTRRLRTRPACMVVWKRNYKDACAFNTFRQNVSAILNYDMRKFFSSNPADEPDKPIVAEYKRWFYESIARKRGLEPDLLRLGIRDSEGLFKEVRRILETLIPHFEADGQQEKANMARDICDFFGRQ